VTRMIATDDVDQITSVVTTTTVFFALAGVATLAATGLLLPFLGSVFHLGSTSVLAARIALLLLGMTTAINYLNTIPSALLFGSGRSDVLSLLGMLFGVAAQLGQLVVVLADGGLVGLVAVSGALAMVALVVRAPLAHRLVLRGHERGHFDWVLLKDLLRTGRRNAIVGTMGSIAYQLDALVIGLILPVRRVAPYDLALSTASFTRSLSASGTNQLFPSYSHFAAVDDRERQFFLYSRAVMVSLAITASVLVALVAFGDRLLHIWLVTVPQETYVCMVALGAVYLFQLPGHQSFVALTAIGKNAVLVRLGTPAALVNLGLSVWATYLFGPIGPALGSLPQVVLLDSVVLPLIVCHVLGVAPRRYLREALAPLAPVVVVSVLVSLVLRLVVHSKSLLVAPTESVIVVAVSLVVLVVVLARIDPDAAVRLRRALRLREPAPRSVQ